MTMTRISAWLPSATNMLTILLSRSCLYVAPNVTALPAEPRLKQMLRDLKLADYYRPSGKWNDFCHPVGKAEFELH